MSFRKKERSQALKAGIFLSVMTLILMILIVSIGKENSLFERKVQLKARVADVKNLKPGAYVELKGIRVGVVDNISIFSDEEVQIDFTILHSELKWIKQDSKIAISTAGLVGDKYLEIYGGGKTSGLFIPKEHVLHAETVADFKQIMDKGESIATTTQKILNRLDLVFQELENGKSMVETVQNMQRASSNLEHITSQLKDAKLAEMIVAGQEGFKRVASSAHSLDQVMKRIEKGPGTMHSLIYDDALYEDLRALLGGAARNKVIKYYIRESIKDSERKKP